MKKIKSILAILLITILAINIKPNNVKAEDTGYYIQNMNVQVDVNEKREYNITETIDVYFNEERHGIIRSMPKSTQLEDYNITNINVDGAPYTIEDYSNLEIRIGDEDETVIGEKRYTIQYTIETYNDEQTEGDYIYLNVLGVEWDTDIYQFSSTITYPNDANLESLNITDGGYGSSDNTYVEYTTQENTIKIQSKGIIPPYSGVTVNAMLNEGAFKDAPVRQYPYTIKSDIINIEITKEKEYLINRGFTIEVNENNSGSKISTIGLWEPYNSNNDYIKEISIDNPKIALDSRDNNIRLPKEAGSYEFKVSYKIEPTLQAPINLSITDEFRAGKTENMQLNITSPFTIGNHKVVFHEKGVNVGTKRYKLEKDENSINFSNINDVNPGEDISIVLNIDNSLFSRPLPMIGKVVTYGSPLILIGVLWMFFKFKEKNPIISAVEFYPPSGMNSAEVAYAYKQSISTKDITTLLFYWASQNHIKITMKKDDEFTLTKLSELDDNHKEYEKELFKEIFKCGDGETVKDSELEGEMITPITKTVGDVSKVFKGKRKLSDTKSLWIGFIGTLISGVPIFLAMMLEGKLSHISIFESSVLGLIGMLILCINYAIFYNFNKNRYTKKGKKISKRVGFVLGILYVVFSVVIFALTEIPSSIALIVIVVAFIGMIASAFIPKRTAYGREVLEQIIGFRNFVEVAEKDRLEALLEEDPEYFYNTLPYAHVLGVTKKWADKFKGITMTQPTFYETYYPLNNVYMMTHLMNDLDRVNSTMTHSNDSSNGGFGGGSGGGFGGGGFSGGGAGGGGGSSW